MLTSLLTEDIRRMASRWVPNSGNRGRIHYDTSDFFNILIDRESGHYRWIDFDFNYMHRENMFSYDLFGLGNILMFIVGMGDVLLADLKNNKPSILDGLNQNDMNIVFHNRVANLKKVYPYISESLNRILLHFSIGTEIHYENTTQLLSDMNEALQAF